MACVKVATSSLIITIFVLLPLLAAGFDLLPPPALDLVCDNVKCGKGTCKPNGNSSFFYECQCDPGWKQTNNNDTGLMFLPCVIPDYQVCNNVTCGKGRCKPNSNSSFFYECQCDPGWKQTAHNDTSLMFLPCVIPNCSLDYSCVKAPAPVQDKSTRANYSIFDPCFWSECGGGSCSKTSQFSYYCICPEGYYNLLNISTFPCIRECSIGLDCANLGITIFSNKSTSPSPPPPTNKGNILWLIMLWTSLAAIWRK